MQRDVSAEDRVSGPVASLSLCERKSVRYSGDKAYKMYTCADSIQYIVT